MALTPPQGLTQLSESYRYGEGLRRWRQLGKVEVALHYEGGVSIVADVLMPQVLEKLVEVAKLIPYERFMDALTSQVSFVFLLFNIVSEPFHEWTEN